MFILYVFPLLLKKIICLIYHSIKKSISIISTYIKSKGIVVLESTVYPGVTEHFAKFLELKTGLKNNKDFLFMLQPKKGSIQVIKQKKLKT